MLPIQMYDVNLSPISRQQFTPSLELVCPKVQRHKKWVFLLFLGCFQCNDIGLHFYGASIITKTTRVFLAFFFKAPTTFTAIFWRKKNVFSPNLFWPQLIKDRFQTLYTVWKKDMLCTKVYTKVGNSLFLIFFMIRKWTLFFVKMVNL